MNKDELNILVVEDEDSIRASINEILLLDGYNVKLASDYHDALEKLHKSEINLILSDIMMPGKNGIELLKTIRSIPEFTTIPFIFLTARTDLNNIREGMNLGADDYITKPFKMVDILKSVELRLQNKLNIENRVNTLLNGIKKYVPHELRTPLVAILGYPEFIKENYDDMDKEEILDLLSSVTHGGQRLLKTLEKFIVFSDLETEKIFDNEVKKYFQEKSLFNNDYILGLLNDSEFFLERKDDFIIEINPHELNIYNTHLKTLLNQLIDNAIKFSPEGSPIKILGYQTDDYYIISIIDSGSGMSNDEISKIGPFIQFNRELNQQSGNGLGLAIVKNIIDSYNLSFQLKSEIGLGTQAKISFKI